MNTRLEIRETALPENVRRIRHQVAASARSAGASRSLVDDVALCVGEAAANVVRHAYKGGVGPITARVEIDDDLLTVVVRDAGRGLAAEDGGAGFGLRIIERLARDMSISSEPGRGTEIRMRFTWTGSKTPRLHALRLRTTIEERAGTRRRRAQ